MNYDFNQCIDRLQTNSLKWSVEENELPMWVADMDFQTAPAIQQALLNRVQHGIFGYATVTDAWYEAYIHWWKTRHHFTLEKDWLMFCTGVVPAISSIVRKLTTPAEKIVVLTPVYNIFFNSIINNGRLVEECALRYKDGEYTIDFSDLEAKLSDSQTTMLILCNPHNPIGKIWDIKTLDKIGNLCKKHHVIVVSDEIHCDLVDPLKSYVPFASVSEICKQISITCIAPTKTFNIAGLQTACISIPNPLLRQKVNRAINTDEVAEPNAFAIDATIAAYTNGDVWLDALREYVYENKKIVSSFIQTNLPQLYLLPSQATYLLWIDCSKVTHDTQHLTEWIRNHTGLYLSYGEQFGKNGKQFIRINIACPKERLIDGLSRLKKGIESYENNCIKW